MFYNLTTRPLVYSITISPHTGDYTTKNYNTNVLYIFLSH